MRQAVTQPYPSSGEGQSRASRDYLFYFFSDQGASWLLLSCFLLLIRYGGWVAFGFVHSYKIENLVKP